MDSKLSGLILESYGRVYDNVLKLQQLYEMEEIIELKSFREKIDNESRTQIQIQREKEYEKMKIKLKLIWSDRLTGCERNIHCWQKILSIRSLILSKSENKDRLQKKILNYFIY